MVEPDNMTTNIDMILYQMEQSDFEFRMSLIVGITFSITFLVGLVGNMMVLITILFQQKMRNTTNILILNLAVASLIFIILCVPSTGLNYVLRYALIIFVKFSVDSLNISFLKVFGILVTSAVGFHNMLHTLQHI